jgi:hypothetical protein
MLNRRQQHRDRPPFILTRDDKMPVKRRTNKRRGAINEYEAAWLESGRADGGFVQFKPDEELQELWERAGDHESFYWTPGMNFPEPIETEEEAGSCGLASRMARAS